MHNSLKETFIRLRNSTERKNCHPGIPQDTIELTPALTLNQLICTANYLLVDKLTYLSPLLRQIARITIQDQLINPTFVITVTDPFNTQQKLDVHLLVGNMSSINLNTPIGSFLNFINYIIYDIRPYP